MADATKFALVPGALNTTLAPTALEGGQARDLLNCDTGRGDWRLDLRHRRFCAPPALESGGEDVPSTSILGGSGSQVSRPGATVGWANPEGAALAGDDATATLDAEGETTHWLRASVLTPPMEIPSNATITSATVHVKHQALPVIVGRESRLDAIRVWVGEDLRHTLSPASIVPVSMTDQGFALDVAALGVTVEELNAAAVSVEVSYKGGAPSSDGEGEPTYTDFDPYRIGLPTSAYNTYWRLMHSDGSGDGLYTDPYPPSAKVATDANGGDFLRRVPQGYPQAGTSSAGVMQMPNPSGYLDIDYATGMPSGIASGADAIQARMRVRADAPCKVLIRCGRTGYNGTFAGGAFDIGTDWQDVVFPYVPLAYPPDYSGFRFLIYIDLEFQTNPDTGTLYGTAYRNYARTVDVDFARLYVNDAALPSTSASTMVAVREIGLTVGYTVPGPGEPDPVVPRGLVFASYDGVEEDAVVEVPGAFVCPGEKAGFAYGDYFGGDVATEALYNEPWHLWVYDGKVFYTSPSGKLWYRAIGGPKLLPVYLDAESPGSSGDASYTASGDLAHIERFDPSVDTIALSNDAGAKTLDAKNGFVASGGDLGLIQIETKKPWLQAEVTLADPIDASGSDSLGIVLTDKAGTSDGYRSDPANNYVVLENSTGTATASLPIQTGGKLGAKGGSYYGFVDLSGVPDSIKGDVKKITMRVATRPGIGSMWFRFEQIAFGGVRYRDTEWGKGATTANTAGTEYAYDVTEGATTLPARLLSVPTSAILGQRLAPLQAFMGGAVTVTVPQGDAPFTTAATIRLYRKVGSDWRRIATGTNDESLVFEDTLQDAEIVAAPGTYPVAVLSFDKPETGFSGQVTGIVCGCAWKGSNVYGGRDGKLYGSRSGFFDDVLWDNVVKTNDVGSEDLGPPRTLVLADDLKSPVLALVPGESLYALTATEVYAMIPGETFATASFPRKCDGARGVVGTKAADLYGDACLYGALDGLWIVKKSTLDSSQPDTLIEATKDNREAWKWLLGTAPSMLVVRQHFGEVWCFNGTRYLHVTRQGRTIKGVWADGRSVVDASGDPARGLVLLLSDGSLAVVGAFVSDGGTDLEGTNGAAPQWSYSTGVRVQGHEGVRVVAHAQIAEGGEVRVAVEGDRPETPARVSVFGEGSRLVSQALDRTAAGGDLLSFTVDGRASDRLLSAAIELTARETHRQLDRTMP